MALAARKAAELAEDAALAAAEAEAQAKAEVEALAAAQAEAQAKADAEALAAAEAEAEAAALAAAEAARKEIELRSSDGLVSVTGVIEAFNDDLITIKTTYGTVGIKNDEIECIGAGCPTQLLASR